MSDLFGNDDGPSENVLWDEDDDDASFSSSDDHAELESDNAHGLSLIGYNAIEAQLIEAINSNRLPHALIFAGDEGRGKESMAYRMTRALLSQKTNLPLSSFDVEANDPIISRLQQDAHPDFRRVARVNKENKNELSPEIVIKTVRSATQFMALKPVEGAWRIVLVDEAHLMNEEAQNAFLKSLEEPPPGTLLILIAHQPARLLPTIRSRAHVVNFPALPQSMLAEQGGSALKAMSHEGQEVVLRLARGGMGALKRLLSEPYAEAIARIAPLLHHASAEDVYGFSESWGSTQLPGKDPLDFLEEIFLDHLTSKLYANLDDFEDKGKLLDAIENVRTLFQNARTRYLDKRQVIREGFSYMKAA